MHDVPWNWQAPRRDAESASRASWAVYGLPEVHHSRIEELVEKHLEAGVGVAEISSRLGYSPSHFSRMFRRSFGITPHTYVMRRRLAVAQSYWREPSWPRGHCFEGRVLRSESPVSQLSPFRRCPSPRLSRHPPRFSRRGRLAVSVRARSPTRSCHTAFVDRGFSCNPSSQDCIPR